MYMLQDAVFCLEISKSLEVAANKQSDGPLKAFLEHKVKSYKRYKITVVMSIYI